MTTTPTVRTTRARVYVGENIRPGDTVMIRGWGLTETPHVVLKVDPKPAPTLGDDSRGRTIVGFWVTAKVSDRIPTSCLTTQIIGWEKP